MAWLGLLTLGGTALGAGIGALIVTEEWQTVPPPWELETAGRPPGRSIRIAFAVSLTELRE
jgi:hypothetical protein